MEVLIHHVSYPDVYFHLQPVHDKSNGTGSANGPVKSNSAGPSYPGPASTTVTPKSKSFNNASEGKKSKESNQTKDDKHSDGLLRLRCNGQFLENVCRKVWEFIDKPSVNLKPAFVPIDNTTSEHYDGAAPPRKYSHHKNQQIAVAKNKICSGFMLDGFKNVWPYHKKYNVEKEKSKKYDGIDLFALAFFDGDLEQARQHELVSIVFPIFALSLDCLLGNIRSRRSELFERQHGYEMNSSSEEEEFCNFLKVYFLSGSDEKARKGWETSSTKSAAKVLARFAQEQIYKRFHFDRSD